MTETPDQVTELEERYAALQQAARSNGAEPGDVLDAAFTELEGAIDLLRAAEAAPAGPGRRPQAEGQPANPDSAERGLLRAVFQDAPVPLFLLTRDGTVQRVNRAAGDLIGAKPGYATGRPFTTFVALRSRAAVNSQLTAVGRTGKQRRLRCSLVAEDGLVPCELVIGRVLVRSDTDDTAPLVVTVNDPPARPRPDDEPGSRSELSAVQAITRRLEPGHGGGQAAARERGLQRVQDAAAVRAPHRPRAHRLGHGGHRAQAPAAAAVRGRPDDPRLTELTSAVAAVDPPPGSLPCAVHESGHPALIAHAEDAGVLGSDLDGEPLLARLDATSVLSVPLADGETRYGVLTLARRAGDGHFKVADLALVTELGEQMALAIRVSRMFRRGSDTVRGAARQPAPEAVAGHPRRADRGHVPRRHRGPGSRR